MVVDEAVGDNSKIKVWPKLQQKITDAIVFY